VSFFNDQIQKVSTTLKNECKDVKALTHIQDWSYNVLANPNQKEEAQSSRIEQAMNDAYYNQKGEQFNIQNQQYLNTQTQTQPDFTQTQPQNQLAGSTGADPMVSGIGDMTTAGDMSNDSYISNSLNEMYKGDVY
jgi:hypothetical protein